MRKHILALLSTLTLLLGSTSSPGSSKPENGLAQPYADFGFDLLRELSAGHARENVFISPYSVAVSLAMLSNGAKGETREAILRTIHSQGQSSDALNNANHALIEQINKTRAVQLAVANGLWVQKSAALNSQFSGALEKSYSAQAQNLDFGQPQAAEVINAWVAQHTNGRISKILDRCDPLTLAILTNAIAFKGKWSLPFEASLTRPHDFKAPSGVRKVSMMTHAAEYSYAKTGMMESIRLPYADGSFATYIFLPRDADAMKSFLERLTAERLSKQIESLAGLPGTIELPRFSLNYHTSLNVTLAKLGMGIAFNRQADFSGISQRAAELRINDVEHASFLKVDEEGTEAAAATSTMVAPASIPSIRPFYMVVDHPFFMAIRDDRNGQLLFMGLINEPQS